MQEIEELFRKLRHHYRLFLKGSNDSFIKMNEIETDLLSKFREIQEQVERLKCCGNCINYGYDMEEDRHYCNKHIYSGKRHAGICTNNWQSDNLTRKERGT